MTKNNDRPEYASSDDSGYLIVAPAGIISKQYKMEHFKMSASELIEFFTANTPFKTKSGILITMVGNVFALTAKLREDKEEGHLYELHDEIYGADAFISQYEIRSIKDLQLMSISKLWIRFLAEAAELIFTNPDDHSIHFRKFRANTMVYSLNLNYYTEVNRLMNMTEHFEAFIAENWKELEVMSYKK